MTRSNAREVLSEVLGAVFALVGLAVVGWEMYHGGPMHRDKVGIGAVLIVGGMYFVAPRNTRQLVALARDVFPVQFGRRSTDAIGVPAAPPSVPVVPTGTPPAAVPVVPVAATAAVVELAQPQTATPAAAHQFDPGA